MELLLQAGLLSAMTAYLVHRRVDLHHRNHESGESLLAQLQSLTSSQTGNQTIRLDEFVHAQEARPDGSQNLGGWWRLYKYADLVLRLADHADLEGSPITAPLDPTLLRSLRRNAMQARITALTGIAKWAVQG